MTREPTAGIGHNMPPDDRRGEFCAAITLWVGNQRLDHALQREELGQLEGLQRVLALRNGLIANCVRFCRQNPRAGAAMAVLTLITFMADNNDGMCRLTVPRMAKIFARNERNIHAAIAVLEKDGLIGVNRVNGLANSYFPLIPAGLDTVGASIAWFADALSDKPKSRVPRTPDVNDRGQHETPDVDDRGVGTGPLSKCARTPVEVRQHSISLREITKGETEVDATYGCAPQESTPNKSQHTLETLTNGHPLDKKSGAAGVGTTRGAGWAAAMGLAATIWWAAPGQLAIATEFHEALLREGATADAIRRGLLKAADRMPLDLARNENRALAIVRKAVLEWVPSDDRKTASNNGRKPGQGFMG